MTPDSRLMISACFLYKPRVGSTPLMRAFYSWERQIMLFPLMLDHLKLVNSVLILYLTCRAFRSGDSENDRTSSVAVNLRQFQKLGTFERPGIATA